MKRQLLTTLFGLCCLLFLSTTSAQAKDFVVVIDAGHGGHDPGAVGRISKEKNINLKVALRVGKLIKEQCNDVKVVYTRQRDVFVALNRRAEIANEAKADLFISIHTNALAKNRTMQGPSTWTLGLAKSDANLEVAKRENAVILYENDYQTRYAGFNPQSAESYIIFEFMQDKYMEQSVHLAQLVQKNFKQHCRRIDRGVHQAGFLVLKESAMPSILVELGFISTPAEERYLNSENGVNTLASGIARAFLSYKREQELRLKGSSDTPIPTDNIVADAPATTAQPARGQNAPTTSQTKSEKQKADTDAPVFKVQFLTSDCKLSTGDRRFKGVKPVDCYHERGIYKYTTGASTNYNEVLRTRRHIAVKFKDAFIIAFKGDKKMDVNQAIREFKNRKK